MHGTKEAPRLSIITATYNRREHLRRALSSVKEQGLCSIEHIIVDNNSDDGTDELIQKYKIEVDYPVIYIREQDSGIYQALNKGIHKACGVWTHILHSDDYYFSHSVLKTQLQHQNVLDEYDVCANAIVYVKEETQFRQLWIPEYQQELNHYRFPHTGLLVKRSFYQKYGLFLEKYRIISDAIWMAQNLPFSKYTILTEPLIVMRKGGLSTRKSMRNFYETSVLVLHYQNFPKSYKRAFLKVHAKKFMKFCLKSMLRKGNR